MTAHPRDLDLQARHAVAPHAGHDDAEDARAVDVGGGVKEDVHRGTVRRVERLYPNVKQLTDSFELHWYGLARATETDWQTFRSGYKQALSS